MKNKTVRMITNNIETKGVEGGDRNLVGRGADKLGKTVVHSLSSGVGESEGKDSGGVGIGLGKNVGNAQSDGLSLAGAGPGKNHDWTLKSVNSKALLGVKSVESLTKS